MYGLGSFSMYALVGFGVLMLGLILFELTTKNREFKLIFDGNVAAALSLGGRLVGLALVIQSAAKNSVSLSDMALWGAIGIVSQIILFYAAELFAFIIAKMANVNMTVTRAIDNDNKAVGAIILLVSVSIGLVIAGCMTYDPNVI